MIDAIKTYLITIIWIVTGFLTLVLVTDIYFEPSEIQQGMKFVEYFMIGLVAVLIFFYLLQVVIGVSVMIGIFREWLGEQRREWRGVSENIQRGTELRMGCWSVIFRDYTAT